MTPREKLERIAGRVPAGCVWLGIPSADAAEIAARGGRALCVIDMEHGAIGPETMTGMLRALELVRREPGGEGRRVGAIVRVPELAEGPVKHALDAGADGVLIPYVETAEQAARAVRAALYAPRGARGAALGVVRASGYGEDAGYGSGWNDRVLVAVQIESRAGLAAAAQIAAVDGIDMLFFGPFDYSQDAGIDPAASGEELGRVLARIVEAARGAGKLAGVFPWPGARPADLAAAGADLVAVASDVAALKGGVAAAVRGSGLS